MPHKKFLLFLVTVAIFYAWQTVYAAGQKASANGSVADFESWSSVLLMNTVFSEEYLSVLNVDKKDNIKSWLVSLEGIQLYKRARFSAVSALANDQFLKDSELLQKVLEKQTALLEKQGTVKKELKPFFGQNGKAKTWEMVLISHLGATFTETSFSGAWPYFEKVYRAGGIPSCPRADALLSKFTGYQKKLAASGKENSGKDWLSILSKSELSEIHCLMYVHFSKKVNSSQFESGFRPEFVLQPLEQTGLIAKDQALRTFWIVRLMQMTNYAEALKHVLELKEKEASYRLVYELIQRVYSYRQRGKGEVSLQGI